MKRQSPIGSWRCIRCRGLLDRFRRAKGWQICGRCHKEILASGVQILLPGQQAGGRSDRGSFRNSYGSSVKSPERQQPTRRPKPKFSRLPSKSTRKKRVKSSRKKRRSVFTGITRIAPAKPKRLKPVLRTEHRLKPFEEEVRGRGPQMERRLEALLERKRGSSRTT